jgi:hypothetical protein
MSRKSQGATEYLIILAVVIIIALIAVGAMGGIPGIGTGAKQRGASSYWQTADMALPTAGISATSGIGISLRNNMKSTVSAVALSINGTVLTCSQTSLAAGQETNCTSSALKCPSAGSSYSYPVEIAYTDEAGKSYTFTGEGHSVEGKCAN